MSRRSIRLARPASALAALALLSACGGKDAARTAAATPPAADSAAVNADAPAPAAAPAATAASAGDVAQAGGRAPNEQGRIPVLEYHLVGTAKNSLYGRTSESFRQDLDEVYRRGYRPITIAQMLDKDFRNVPAGMSPVVFVFDDASPEQFRYLDRGGKLDIDPASALGMMLEFAKTHPGWKNTATFCMLNGGASGHNFFGDSPKFQGQKKEWRFQKVQWLAQNGYELCAHTLWHARLDKYSDAVVQEQIARNVAGIDSAVPGYKVRSFALPYGIWPKNRSLAFSGSWRDPKSGKTLTYKFDDVMEVSGGPTRSPYDAQFNPKSVTRIEAIGDDIRKTLDRLDKPLDPKNPTATRFVSDGKP